MSLTVKIGDAATEEIEEAPKKPVISVELNVRKTTDGNLMITDHPEKEQQDCVFPEGKNLR